MAILNGKIYENMMIKREHLTYWYPMVAIDWDKKDDKSGVTRQSNRNNDDLGYPILGTPHLIV